MWQVALKESLELSRCSWLSRCQQQQRRNTLDVVTVPMLKVQNSTEATSTCSPTKYVLVSLCGQSAMALLLCVVERRLSCVQLDVWARNRGDHCVGLIPSVDYRRVQRAARTCRGFHPYCHDRLDGQYSHTDSNYTMLPYCQACRNETRGGRHNVSRNADGNERLDIIRLL